jgi:hypothetical protein
VRAGVPFVKDGPGGAAVQGRSGRCAGRACVQCPRVPPATVACGSGQTRALRERVKIASVVAPGR